MAMRRCRNAVLIILFRIKRAVSGYHGTCLAAVPEAIGRIGIEQWWGEVGAMGTFKYSISRHVPWRSIGARLVASLSDLPTNR